MAVATGTAMMAALAYSMYQGEEQRRAQQSAQDQARRDALDAEKKADEAMNRANQKKPNQDALLSAIERAGRGGVSGTMLTGPSGVDPGRMSLGRNTLLGG